MQYLRREKHNKNYGQKRLAPGFTLIESILALTLTALMLASLATMFTIIVNGWRENNQRQELMQHARVALARLSDDLRYTVRLDTLNTNDLTFITRKLESDTWTTCAPITYSHNATANELTRVVAPYSPEVIAGSDFEDIEVINFTKAALKIATDGTVVPLGTDPLDQAVGVEVALTLQDYEGDTVTLGTTIMFRNKFPRQKIYS